MKQLIICREYPPAPSGGIGMYVEHMSRLLAESGETVHVISQQWEGAEKEIEEKCSGKLIIHRLPFEDWTSFVGRKLNPAVKSREGKGLYESSYSPQCFSWLAGLLAEDLIEQEGIDIIEAQDFEAPLYYLQLRRTLGLGPKRHPPCIVHLHSPTEKIARYNDWDTNHVYFRTAKRLENYSLAAADGLLCPSRFLAGEVEALYGLATGSVRVIPYPLGDIPLLQRNQETWKHGTICYMGRLEPRKGILEWIDAAVTVAHEHPQTCFEFIGANVLGGNKINGDYLVQQRIPHDLKRQFLFRGHQQRSALPGFLTGARMSVIPSRWDNFPNSCIEAMSSGLPVIASRHGGMVEMVEDGRTGWIVRKEGSEGLAEALKRALDTPPSQLAQMGRQAASAIRTICDNKKTVESQLEFRSQVIQQGARHSVSLPANLSWSKKLATEEPRRRGAQNRFREGVAIVVTCFNNGRYLEECLRRLERQTQKPAALVIVDDGSTEERTLNVLNEVNRTGWRVIQTRHRGDALAKNAGIDAILGLGVDPLAFAFLIPEDQPHPSFVAACEAVLLRCPEVGTVSCWVCDLANNKLWSKPCPCFPDQWMSSDAAPFSAVRTEALREAGHFRAGLNPGYNDWDLFNAVMAAGWTAVTVPEILGARPMTKRSTLHRIDHHSHARMHQELLTRFPDLMARDAADIVLLGASEKIWAINKELVMLGEQVELAREAMRRPAETVLHVLGKLKSKLRHVPVRMTNFFGL